MAAVPVTITGVLSYSGLEIGGGPMPGGPPVGIWPSPGHPAHPIAPGGPPLGIWGGVAPPYPAHPIAPGGPPLGIWGGAPLPWPTPPIYLPPGPGKPPEEIWPGPGKPTHPIVLPPGPPPLAPTHPIVIPPEDANISLPIFLPGYITQLPVYTAGGWVFVWVPGVGWSWVPADLLPHVEPQ
jgi:hypothetical protein